MLSSLRDNPLFRYLLKRSFSTREVIMLAVYVGAASSLMYMVRHIYVTTGEQMVLSFALAWAVGEFFWCWMCADHLFTAWGKFQRSGMGQDLQLTPMTRREVAHALIANNVCFIGIAVVLWGIAELFVPWPRTAITLGPAGTSLLHLHMSDSMQALRLGNLLFVLAAIPSHVATCYLASRLYAARLLNREAPATFWVWMRSLFSIATLLYLTTGACLGLAMLITSAISGRFNGVSWNPMERLSGIGVALFALALIYIYIWFLARRRLPRLIRWSANLVTCATITIVLLANLRTLDAGFLLQTPLIGLLTLALKLQLARWIEVRSA